MVQAYYHSPFPKKLQIYWQQSTKYHEHFRSCLLNSDSVQEFHMIYCCLIERAIRVKLHALQKKYFTAILSTTTVQVDCLRCEAELLYTFCIVISGQYLVVSQRVFISGAIVSVTHKGDFYVFINDLQSWIF